MAKKSANEIEVDREARIAAAAAKIKAREDAEILAAAAAEVDAAIAAEAEVERIRREEETNAKYHAEAKRARSAGIKEFAGLLSGWMVQNDSDDIYAAPVDELRKQAGL